jgi:hypothetical protein
MNFYKRCESDILSKSKQDGVGLVRGKVCASHEPRSRDLRLANFILVAAHFHSPCRSSYKANRGDLDLMSVGSHAQETMNAEHSFMYYLPLCSHLVLRRETSMCSTHLRMYHKDTYKPACSKLPNTASQKTPQAADHNRSPILTSLGTL